MPILFAVKMAQIARLKCPFLSRIPAGLTKKAGASLLSYSENCPVMTQLLANHASTKAEENQHEAEAAAGCPRKRDDATPSSCKWIIISFIVQGFHGFLFLFLFCFCFCFCFVFVCFFPHVKFWWCLHLSRLSCYVDVAQVNH